MQSNAMSLGPRCCDSAAPTCAPQIWRVAKAEASARIDRAAVVFEDAAPAPVHALLHPESLSHHSETAATLISFSGVGAQ